MMSFIMLSHQHMVTASKLQTNQSMNQMIAQVIHMCVLPVKKIWHFSSKFDQHLSLYCGSLKPKLQMGIGYWFFVGYNFQIYWKFWHHSSKIHLKAVVIFVPLKYVERNGMFGSFNTSVNGNVMLAHIMTFPFTSVSQNFVGEEEWSIQFSCNLIIFLNFSCF